MFKKFNTLFKSILLEEAEIDLSKDKDSSVIKGFYNTNIFFYKFLLPLSKKDNVRITKQSNNCFLVYGIIEDVLKFFRDFKVNKEFMDSPQDFNVISPLYSFGEINGKLNLDQYYPTDNFNKNGIPFTHEAENLDGNVLEGYWRNIPNNKNGKVFEGHFGRLSEKMMTPSNLGKAINELCGGKNKNSDIIYVEFSVNTEGLKNILWDEMTEYAKDPDEMNEYHNSIDDTKFNYEKLNNNTK